MAEKIKDKVISETKETPKQPKEVWKTKECPVVSYVSSQGIVGFMFDDMPCQIVVKDSPEIKSVIKIQYKTEDDGKIIFKY